MNDVINDAIDQIIINLKTIGKIRINDKIYISNGYIIIQKDTFMRSLIRTMYGYSREQSCLLIQEIVSKGVRASNTMLGIAIDKIDDTNIHLVNYLKIMISLRESFSQCQEGLNNFMRTYINDQTIVSRIENLISHVDNQLTLMDSKLGSPEYKEIIQKFFPQKLEKYITSNHTGTSGNQQIQLIH
jgi:hypothetical protein